MTKWGFGLVKVNIWFVNVFINDDYNAQKIEATLARIIRASVAS